MNCAAQQVKRSFMQRIIQSRDVQLPAMQKLCLMVLAVRCNEDETCWPSIEQIAADMGCHRTTAIRALQQLEEAGLIEVDRQLLDNGRPAANVYKVTCGDSSGARPLQSRSATGIVAESDGDSSGERLEVVTTEVRKEKGSESANVVNFSTWAQPAPTADDDSPQVVFKGGVLTANGAFRRFWLPDFDDDDHQLDLAILQAAPYIQAGTSKPLEALLSSQLARQVRDRADRDARYQAAKADITKKSETWAERQDREHAAAWKMIHRLEGTA